jgi:hypothetical protein
MEVDLERRAPHTSFAADAPVAVLLAAGGLGVAGFDGDHPPALERKGRNLCAGAVSGCVASTKNGA